MWKKLVNQIWYTMRCDFCGLRTNSFSGYSWISGEKAHRAPEGKVYACENCALAQNKKLGIDRVLEFC